MNQMIGYVRVSTDEQGQSGLGLDAQVATIEAYAKGAGLTIVRWAHEVDSAVSGKRPVRFETLQAIANGEADGVIVAAQSRISRSVVETCDLLEWAERKQLRVVLCDTGTDTGTPAGKLVAQLMAAVAEHEAAQISERTRNALAAKRARGEEISRPSVPAKVAELIRELRADGLSLRAIAAELNERKIPTPRGASEWRHSSIQRAVGYKRPAKRVRAALPA